MAGKPDPATLYNDYKHQRAERRKKAAERRSQNPDASWDLPMLSKEQAETKEINTGFQDGVGPEWAKPEWYQESAEETAAPLRDLVAKLNRGRAKRLLVVDIIDIIIVLLMWW